MKTIKVQVTGLPPGVMTDAFTKEREAKLAEGGRITQGIKPPPLSPQEQAEEGAYRLKGKKSNLYLPFSYFYGTMVNAAIGMKSTKVKSSLKNLIAGCVRVEPEKIDLKTNKFEVDSRTAFNHAIKGRILKHRPKIFPWKADFEIVYNEEMINPAVLKELLSQAGLRIGIGSYRPAKSGPFGTFKITKWQE